MADHAQDHDVQSHHPSEGQQQRKIVDCLRDLALWRRNKVATNATILVVSTAAWVLLQVYRINALTLLSWLAILLISLLFLWGTFLRLLRKEPPDLRGMEISEQQVLEAAYACKAESESALRWMLHLTIEGDWLAFTGTVAGLLLLSYVATFFDLPTLVYTGIVTGMTVPAVYVKYGDGMKRWGQMMEEQGRRLYHKAADGLVIENLKEKVSGKAQQHKDKKTE